MFHFPSLAPMMAIHSPPGHRHTDGQVTPFGHPRINAQLPTPRGLTQTHTSFIGLPCPRHPPCAQKNTHKKHSTKKKNARVHFPVLTHHNHNHHKHPTNEAPTTAEASHTTPQQCHARHPTACQHTPQPTPHHDTPRLDKGHRNRNADHVLMRLTAAATTPPTQTRREERASTRTIFKKTKTP